MKIDIKILSIKKGVDNLKKYENLFLKVYPSARNINYEYLDWLYFKNPDGQVIGYDAWHENKLIGHYACLPKKSICDDKIEKTLLSLNTATHPDYRRKGIFKLLATKTYATASKMGFKTVIGVSNAQSTNGFTKYLDFKIIAPLNIMIGIGNLNLDSTKLSETKCFRLLWEPNHIRWRVQNPRFEIFVKTKNRENSYFSEPFMKMLTPYAENPFIKYFEPNSCDFNIKALKMFIGLIPKNSMRKNFFISIPQILRPVPFNFIFKRLGGDKKILSKENIFFSFLDFDVF